jgi:hypothetical protein
MAAIEKQINFTAVENIRARVRATVFSTAISVMNEAETVENHNKRVALAAAVINSPDLYVDRFILGAAVGPYSLVDEWSAADDPAHVEDSAIQWVVGELWNIMANAMTLQSTVTLPGLPPAISSETPLATPVEGEVLLPPGTPPVST